MAKMSCPSCGDMFEGSTGQIGRIGLCPKCGQRIIPRPCGRDHVGLPVVGPAAIGIVICIALVLAMHSKSLMQLGAIAASALGAMLIALIATHLVLLRRDMHELIAQTQTIATLLANQHQAKEEARVADEETPSRSDGDL